MFSLPNLRNALLEFSGTHSCQLFRAPDPNAKMCPLFLAGFSGGNNPPLRSATVRAHLEEPVCYLKTSALPFGGLYVLFTGDVHQLPCLGDRSLYIDYRDDIRARRELLIAARKDLHRGE
jgi:hypothetical protein